MHTRIASASLTHVSLLFFYINRHSSFKISLSILNTALHTAIVQWGRTLTSFYIMNTLLTFYNFFDEVLTTEHNTYDDHINFFDKTCYYLLELAWTGKGSVSHNIPDCIPENCKKNLENMDLPSYSSYLYLLPLALGSYLFVYLICMLWIDLTPFAPVTMGPNTYVYLDTYNPIPFDPTYPYAHTFFSIRDIFDTEMGFVFNTFEIKLNIVGWIKMCYTYTIAPQELINSPYGYVFNNHVAYVSFKQFLWSTATLLIRYDYVTDAFNFALY